MISHTDDDDLLALADRLEAPAYWFSGSDEGHEGENTAPVRAAAALLREAMGAFENAMGHLDTPISRRKIGIDPNEEWLLDARATLAKLRAHLDGEKK